MLAAELFDAECNEIEYRATMDWEGDTISVGFQPVPPKQIDITSCQVEAGPIQPANPKVERPEFGPRLDTNSTEFSFKDEMDQLPFQQNNGKEANLMQKHSCFINLIYDNKVVFSLK